MLSQATRHRFTTLLDAITLTSSDSTQDALIFLQTGQDEIIVSRQQFREQVAAHASALTGIGVGPGDLIVIAHVQNLESIFAFWGALYIGAIPSMFPTLTEKLDPEVYMRDMAHLVELSGVRVILTTDDFAPQLQTAVNCPVYGSTSLLSNPHPNGSSPSQYQPNAGSIAFLQHSSGTTGLQKGVALSHQAVLNQLASYSDSLSLAASDVIVSWLPLYHDMGLIAGFLLPVIQGIPLVIMSPFDWVSHPAMLFHAIDHYRGTLCWLPNFAYNHCARRIRQRDLEGVSLASMRAFINCSEPVHHESHQLFQERFGDLGIDADHLTVSYAMAENVFAVTQSPIGQSPKIDWVDKTAITNHHQAIPANPESEQTSAQVSCGPPIAGVAVQAVDKAGQPLPDREIGEIALKSHCMLTSYYRRPDLQPLTPDGWYRTGDMGYIADGEVYIVGRYKDLIINAGKNVYPQDIEAIINMVPGVHPGRAVVFGVPDEREGTELIAAVAEVDTEDTAQRKQIERQIRQAVSQQTTVTLTYVQTVDARWLLKTSSGKIARAANRDKWLSLR